MDHSCLNCKSMEQTSCECPCECSLYTSSCAQQNIDSLNSCPPLYEQGSSLQTPWIQPANLKSCPSVECKSYATERDCLGVADCQWCHVDADAETLLQQPFCSDTSVCFKGIFGSVIPYNDGTYSEYFPLLFLSHLHSFDRCPIIGIMFHQIHSRQTRSWHKSGPRWDQWLVGSLHWS